MQEQLNRFVLAREQLVAQAKACKDGLKVHCERGIGRLRGRLTKEKEKVVRVQSKLARAMEAAKISRVKETQLEKEKKAVIKFMPIFLRRLFKSTDFSIAFGKVQRVARDLGVLKLVNALRIKCPNLLITYVDFKVRVGPKEDEEELVEDGKILVGRSGPIRKALLPTLNFHLLI
ncbi:hypothetical protein Tco_0262010 [Tanacetum coccineum]